MTEVLKFLQMWGNKKRKPYQWGQAGC